MAELPRRKARENAFLALFAAGFGTPLDEQIAHARAEEDPAAVDAFGEGLLLQYQAHAPEVEREIETRLKGWKVQRLPKVTLAILRLAVAEMLYGGQDMDSIVINEAVELSKRYGDEGDYQFVNGLLGAVSRAHHGPGQAEAGLENAPDAAPDTAPAAEIIKDQEPAKPC